MILDKCFWEYPIEILNVHDLESSYSTKGKKVGTGYGFFKCGYCADRYVVCAVRTTALSTTIKVLDPTVSTKRGLGAIFGRGQNEEYKVYKVIF